MFVLGMTPVGAIASVGLGEVKTVVGGARVLSQPTVRKDKTSRNKKYFFIVGLLLTPELTERLIDN